MKTLKSGPYSMDKRACGHADRIDNRCGALLQDAAPEDVQSHNDVWDSPAAGTSSMRNVACVDGSLEK
jgi:hypothetical protein